MRPRKYFARSKLGNNPVRNGSRRNLWLHSLAHGRTNLHTIHATGISASITHKALASNSTIWLRAKWTWLELRKSSTHPQTNRFATSEVHAFFLSGIQCRPRRALAAT